MKPNSIISAAIPAFLALACSATNSASDGAALPLRVIDSALTAPSWNLMADSVITYRMEVRSAASLDTLGNVITPLPIVVGDSLIVGLRLIRSNEDEAERRLFRYHVASGREESWPVPSDVWSFYHDIVPSPDGRYFAYVASDDSGTVAVVRELESGREVLRGAAGGGCDCDVDKNHARWVAPDSVEIAVAHTHTEGGWQIVAGDASTRSVSVIQVDDEPAWHAPPPH